MKLLFNAISKDGVLCSLKVSMRSLIISPLILLLACVVLTAAPLPLDDPQILIDTGGDPLPISTSLGVVQPCGSQHCTFDFFNDTGAFVTSFLFEAMVNAGLQNIGGVFTCSDPHGFFMGCHVDYNSTSGDLKFLFEGVVSPSNGIDPPGPHGIPPNADFFVALDGWVHNDNLFPGGDPPALTNTFTTSPEPSAWLTLGTGLLLLGGFRYRRSRGR